MISKRKLMAYRRAALERQDQSYTNKQRPFETIRPIIQLNKQILELTQELIDQHLLLEATKTNKKEIKK